MVIGTLRYGTERHVLRSRIIFRYHVFEMLETSVLGLGQDLGLLSIFKGLCGDKPAMSFPVVIST